MIVGGTGLYIKALIEGIDVAVKPDLLLRKKLDEFNVEELQNELKRIDSNKFNILNNSDMSNRRRLVRAIEIIVNSKKQKAKSKKKIEFESLVIGLTCEKEVLKQRIDKRVEKRLENGALREVEGLFKDYVNLSPQVKNANGYKQLFQFFNKKITFDEAIYRWKISEYRHAKNQMTWFRKYGNVEWFDITTKKFDKQVENRLKKFLS